MSEEVGPSANLFSQLLVVVMPGWSILVLEDVVPVGALVAAQVG